MMTEKFTEWSINAFSEAVASHKPTPGGGSVAALAGALAASAAHMAAAFTTGKKYEADSDKLAATAESFDAARKECLRLVDADAKVFSRVTEAYAMPRATTAEKSSRRIVVRSALAAAAEVPENLLDCCSTIAEALTGLEPLLNPQLAADMGLAAVLVSAAAHGALLNIDGNLRGEKYAPRRQAAVYKVEEIERLTKKVFASALAMVRTGGKRR